MPPASDPEPSSNCATSNIRENEEFLIRDVWASSLEDEFRIIRQIVKKYKYIAMDTEFPGIVCHPIVQFNSIAEYQYNSLKNNVNLLKIIQLGLTFIDEDGNYPPGCSTWQFNFKFSVTEDMHAEDSIKLLANSGIQFDKHEKEGIEPFDFAELLMSSGVVLMEDVKIITFQGAYDFGYLLKMLTGEELPEEETEFMELLMIFFPVFYDVKYLMKSCRHLRGGLKEVAEHLKVQRIGRQHQAGSDSLLTGETFFKMREMYFENYIEDQRYLGRLDGPTVSMMFLEERSIPPTKSANSGG